MIRKILYFFRFYCTPLFYGIGAAVVALFILALFWHPLQQAGDVAMLGLAVLGAVDLLLVFLKKQPVTVQRSCTARFSNGDDNKVTLTCTNHLSYKVTITLIDELPVQLQERNWSRSITLEAGETRSLVYTIKPVERGEYHFGIIHVLLRSPLFMLMRQISTGGPETVAVYPSFLQMRRYQLMAVTNQLNETGSRQLRKIGNSMEFEQIKEYVNGDDYRTVNWKATARKNALMVNTFTDERSQQIICLVDKGRSMKMPFDGMTLLDYAINASLVLGNTVLLKQDKAGLLTFGKKVDQYVAPDKKSTQLSLLLETLYKQQTVFQDSDFEALYSFVRYRIKQRSLLVLFTNFESMYAMQRQLPYLQKLASHHPLIVVFFENTGLKEMQEANAQSLPGIYDKAIAGKFVFEKRQIVKELQKYGVMALLTEPQQLTANVINKYLEVKARQVV
ncbi:DUF58 domain-containing protein [Deminuibacter soli]|uniref:DUF58 domain-containing protein n=1 Tax=Deminuibacter soli TaxID=2291815 RepID=A0A3E1NMC5_9BACT|nr:DUF58 domain-containing protein [Deminuibacter soli]RFM28968.1 DUF58 domain-containing protein [Deminuibacter soli]